jgi:hypothetical protein
LIKAYYLFGLDENISSYMAIEKENIFDFDSPILDPLVNLLLDLKNKTCVQELKVKNKIN